MVVFNFFLLLAFKQLTVFQYFAVITVLFFQTHNNKWLMGKISVLFWRWEIGMMVAGEKWSLWRNYVHIIVEFQEI